MCVHVYVCARERERDGQADANLYSKFRVYSFLNIHATFIR